MDIERNMADLASASSRKASVPTQTVQTTRNPIRSPGAHGGSRRVNRLRCGIALACGLGVAAVAQASPASTHEDHAAHAASAASAPAPRPAQRWATDAPLREGMARVRIALDELRHYEMGHMPASMALERVASIEDATTYMFAHCKLAPDADAALHGILLPLLAAAQRMKKDTRDMAAIAAMRSVVADYPRHFDDPQWTAEADSTHAGH